MVKSGGKPKPMRVAALQLPIRMEVAANLADLEAAISMLEPHTLAVAPEGCLSGYLPEPGFVGRLDDEVTARAIERARDMAAGAGIHLVVGACLEVEGVWRNAAFCMGPQRRLWRYDKINLAQSERGDFTPGDELPVFDLIVDGKPVRLGVQICREIRYPEQWRWLAMRGAQVIAYVNNAVGSAHGHDLWRAHAVSRAAETQRFVVGANNAAPDQTCPTLVVTPSGKVIAEAPVGETTTVVASIDLAEVSDWIIGQARGDVVAVTGV
jgi:predicted amidohydrolase